jgi:hypothetical protein
MAAFAPTFGTGPSRAAGQAPKCILKSEPEARRIVIDSETTLTDVPAEAWTYRLGNRSAIDWVLDQHKEKKPKDPTIREKFDTYRFAEHKERVIELLARVVRVSMETVRIVQGLALLDHAASGQLTQMVVSPYGTRYIVRGGLRTPDGRSPRPMMCSVWQTAYPD